LYQDNICCCNQSDDLYRNNEPFHSHKWVEEEIDLAGNNTDNTIGVEQDKNISAEVFCLEVGKPKTEAETCEQE